MTRKELKETIALLPFEYICKIKGNKDHLRYHYNKNEVYWFLLTVNYKDNSCSLIGFGEWPNERIETKFDNLFVHDLNKEQFMNILNCFI